jgi:hypothetical protein
VILDKSALAGTVEAAPEAPSAPAGLTPKKTDEDGIERRWFGG